SSDLEHGYYLTQVFARYWAAAGGPGARRGPGPRRHPPGPGSLSGAPSHSGRSPRSTGGWGVGRPPKRPSSSRVVGTRTAAPAARRTSASTPSPASRTCAAPCTTAQDSSPPAVVPGSGSHGGADGLGSRPVVSITVPDEPVYAADMPSLP